MNKFYDVVVAKEYTVKNNGVQEKRTAWNRIGRAWVSGSKESISFEIFLLPGQRYVINLRDREERKSAKEVSNEEAPF